MEIPFLKFFKKYAPSGAPKTAAMAHPPVAKAEGDRMSKTVMPNATRSFTGQDPFHPSAGMPSSLLREGPAAMPGAMPSAAAPPAPGPRTVSFGGGPARTLAPRPKDLPPAVAHALEPKVERVIALPLGEVIGLLPEGYAKPVESVDATRRVLLKASELERGMSTGRPSVSITSIYNQMPEVFLNAVAPSDTTEVALPFGKVMEQFTKLQVRGDQLRDGPVPQVETPFLKVTLEDNTKFGIEPPVEPPATSELPPVRVEAATAHAFAAAEPDATFIASKPANLPSPAAAEMSAPASTNGAADVSADEPPAKPAPTRIEFKLPPNGTGAPAPERVPASSGPSVPTPPPLTAPSAPLTALDSTKPAEPVRIAFKTTAPSDDLRPKAPRPAPEAPAAPAPLKNPAGIPISLPLRPIMQSLPPFQLKGDANSVAEDARVELPFAMVEPQLMHGRVLIAPKIFAEALPAEYRPLFDEGDTQTQVSLPLQDVLKNLPAASLQLRDDQVEQEAGSDFATPFSAAAAEDAKRLNVAPAPVAKPTQVEPLEPVAEMAALPPAPAPEIPAVEIAPEVSTPATPLPVLQAVVPPQASSVAEPQAEAATPAPAPVEPAAEAGSAPAGRTELQRLFDTDDELDAKAVVARVDRMPGVKASAILFGDGLSLAGNLPAELEADGLCAMAPSLLQKAENHIVETKLGNLRAMTLTCAKSTVTFFMHENLCLTALHANGELTPAVREQLSTVVQELSQKYSNPA